MTVSLKEKKVVFAICQRCNHEWIPRDVTSIKVCPKCKSPYWDTPKKEKG